MSDTPKVVWRSGNALPPWSAGMGSVPGSIPGAGIPFSENEIFRPIDLVFG